MIFSSKDYDSERYAVDIGVFHPPGLQQRKSPSHSWSAVQDPTEFKKLFAWHIPSLLSFWDKSNEKSWWVHYNGTVCFSTEESLFSCIFMFNLDRNMAVNSIIWLHMWTYRDTSEAWYIDGQWRETQSTIFGQEESISYNLQIRWKHNQC